MQAGIQGRAMKRRHRFITIGLIAATVLVFMAYAHHKPRLYTVTVLPSLDGQSIMPCAINERGQVVGLRRVKRVSRLFLWDRAGGMRDLGIECGGADINNAGQIVTTTIDPNGTHRAVLWDPVSGIRIIGPPGVNSVACAINNLGQVVGMFEASPKVWHAFVWDQTSGMRDLGQGSDWTMNDAGQVIMSIAVRNNRTLTERTLIVDAGRGDVTTGLQTPLKGRVGINSHGWISGFSWPSAAGPGKIDVALWHPSSTLKVLTQVDAQAWSHRAINDANHVLITSAHPETKVLGRTILPAHRQCYVHDPQRGLVSLDRYLLRAGPGSPSVRDLNNQGCIIGWVTSRDGQRSTGVLLEPIPKRWGW
jgi:probable HAF family extracellular repeat protein